MRSTKEFEIDNGNSPFSSDEVTGIYNRASANAKFSLGNLIEDLLDGKDAVLTVFKAGNRIQAKLTTGDPGEIAMPGSLVPRGKCSCGDPAPSNGGTEIVTGGPTSWLAPGVRLSSVAPSEPPCCTHSDVMGTFSAPSPHAETTGLTGGPSPEIIAARVEDTAKAMDEVRAAMATAPSGWETVKGGTVEDGCSVMTVALGLDERPVEAPKPAPLFAPVSEPNTAPVGVLADPEEPSGVLLTTRAAELKKVPLGAATE